MSRHAAVAFAVLFVAASPGIAAPQDPKPEVAAAEVLHLADGCFGGGEAAAAALQQLDAMVERDYPHVFAAWEREPDGARRTLLENVLQIPAARAAATIVRGAIAKVETVQGGVVDYHLVLVHFAAPDVLRAAADARRDLRDGSFAVLSGTNQDTWLGEQLRQVLERVAGSRVWLFTPRQLRNPTADGGLETGVTLQEWIALPAAAGPCLRRLLQ